MIIVIILIVLIGVVYLIMNSSTQSVTTQQNIFKLDDIYKPITTLPPKTQPSLTSPPFTSPSFTQPPFTQPSFTQTPFTQTPFTQPPSTQSSITRPPFTSQPLPVQSQPLQVQSQPLPVQSQPQLSQPSIDCVVGDWSNWGACSKNCDGGVQQRTKSITRQPQNGGRACPTSAELTESRTCNTQPCPVDCVVGDWSNWGACSKNCDGGTQQRTKSIITQPQNGGRACPPSAELTESRTCNTQPCPKPQAQWVICGLDSNQIPTIGYSMDGRSWNNTNKLISTTGSFNSVAYNGNMWVVVGNSQGSVKFAISTDGINWSLINNYIRGDSYEVCWGGSLWVAAGYTSDIFTGWSKANILTSPDGMNWTESFVVNGSNTSFYTIAYNPSNNTWVAAGAKVIYYSKDAKSWNSVYSDVVTDNGIVKITVINSIFVATVMSNRANMIYSADGIKWNIYNTTIPGNIMSNPNKIIIYKNQLIVGGLGMNQMAYSNNNGLNWYGSLQSYYSLNITNYVATNNDLIIAVGYDRKIRQNPSLGQILTSYDGTSWSLNTIDFITNILCIASNVPL